MNAHPHKMKSPYEKWQDTVNLSKDDPQWNGLDATIQSVVTDFNSRLGKGGNGYQPLDWKLVKAIVWTESGGPDSTAWKLRPMQIGNPGDPGLNELLSGERGSDLILTPALKQELQKGVSTPETNIKAGVGYLLMRAATVVVKSVPDPTDSTGSEVVVKAGDSLDKIAKANSTTLDMLKALNPTAGALIKPGQRLKSKRASMQSVITRWAQINTDFTARTYNTGDAMYKQKLDYCLSIMPK